MVTTPATEKLTKQKLEAFERLHPEFEASYYFIDRPEPDSDGFRI